MLDLRGTVAFGIFLRNMHRWAAHGMVAMVFLHMCRVFLTGAYKRPREFNWVIGVVLLLVTLFLSFTGYLLPWDQLAFWAITVGTSIAGYAPLDRASRSVPAAGRHHRRAGSAAALLRAARGGAAGGADLLMAIHFWRIRKDGGLSRPEAPAPAKPESGVVQMRIEPGKRGVTACRASCADRSPRSATCRTTRYTAGRNLLIAELFVFVLTVSAILVVSLLFNAPLEQPVNVMHPPNPAKAPWYFLGLQEMVSYSAFWGGIGVPTIMVVLLLLAALYRPRPDGRGQVVRPGAAAGQHDLPDAGDAQRDLHHHRHVLPRAELVVRVSVLRGLTRMRLALAIASFVILIVHGVVFYDQFFHHWERHQTAYFDQAQVAGQPTAKRRPNWKRATPQHRADHRHAASATPAWTAASPATSPPTIRASPGHAQPLKTHPYSAALGDVQRNGHWERRHKFSDFGCTVCHDGQGRGLETDLQPRRGRILARAAAGLRDAGQLAQGFRAQAEGQGVHGSQLRPVPHRRGFRRHAQRQPRPQAVLRHELLRLPQDRRHERRHAGPRSDRGRQEVSRSTTCGSRIVEPRANLATSFMPKFNLGDADVKALVIFLKSRRGVNFAETSLDRYKAHVANVAVVIPPGTAGEKAGEQLIADRACTACHKLGDKDGGIAPDLSYEGLIRDDDWLLATTSRIRGRACPIRSCRRSASRTKISSASATYLASLKTPPADDGAGRNLQGPLRALPRRKGRRQRQGGLVSRSLAARFHQACVHELQAARPLRRRPSRKACRAPPCRPGARLSNDDQVNGVLDYVSQTFTKEPDKAAQDRAMCRTRTRWPRRSASIAHGEEIFLQRCAGCHGRKADGKGPNSLDIMPASAQPAQQLVRGQASADRRLFESILYGVAGHGHAVLDRLRLVAARRGRHHEFHSQSERESRESTECNQVTGRLKPLALAARLRR